MGGVGGLLGAGEGELQGEDDAVPTVDAGDGGEEVGDFLVGEVGAGGFDEVVREGRFGEAGEGFAEGEGGALAVGEAVGGFVPGREEVKEFVGEAGAFGEGGVHEDAEGAAVDLGGADFEEFDEVGFEARGGGGFGEGLEGVDDLGGEFTEAGEIDGGGGFHGGSFQGRGVPSNISVLILYQGADMKSKPRRSKGGAGEVAVRVPAVGEGKRGVEGHIAYLLRQAAAAVRGEMDAAFGEMGVTSPQFVVMTMVQAYAGISNAALARVAMLTPQTVNMIVRNLEGRRLLEKAADPGHGRILQLRLTEKGAAVLAECRRKSQKVQARMVSGLKREEESVVRRWLVFLAEMGAGRE